MSRPDLADVLYRLLYDVDFRTAFLDGEHAHRYPDLTPEQLDAMESIDPDELRRTTKRIWTVASKGNGHRRGGLALSFPKTIRALDRLGMTAESVTGRFLKSEAFVDVRQTPYETKGICQEEAFHRFLADEPDFAEHADLIFVAETESIKALLTYVRLGALATFEVRNPRFREGVGCWYAVLEHRESWCRAHEVEPVRTGAVLYAIGRLGQVIGACPEWMDEVLRTGRHDDPDVLDHLRGLGLLPT